MFSSRCPICCYRKTFKSHYVSERVQNNSRTGLLINRENFRRQMHFLNSSSLFKTSPFKFIHNQYSVCIQTYWSQISYSVSIKNCFLVTVRELRIATDLDPLTHLSNHEIKCVNIWSTFVRCSLLVLWVKYWTFWNLLIPQMKSFEDKQWMIFYCLLLRFNWSKA